MNEVFYKSVLRLGSGTANQMLQAKNDKVSDLWH